MQCEATTELGTELDELLSRCGTDARVVEDSHTQLRLTNIPHSATHMLPGGMSTLELLGDYWEDWQIEYVDNGGTVMYGSKDDKDVIITRTA
jgi:hypothetical protein